MAARNAGIRYARLENRRTMMRRVTRAIVFAVILATAGCSSAKPENNMRKEETEIIVFAAASMTETMTEIAEMYHKKEPDINIIYNFDSSGTLKTQIQEGADCDIFISAAQKQMNELDISSNANSEKQDFVDPNTRFDLISNSIVLITPKGNPAGIEEFEDVATDIVDLIVLGNADVPVGQYSEEIFTYIGLWEKLNYEKKITFGTNVKEVIAQVEAQAADCGVVYSTDAASSEDVEVVCHAPEDSHRPITYPVAILKNSEHKEEAEVFLEYLKGDDCRNVFEKAGFIVDRK
ncbi:molybdate-binding protein ModA [Clostridiales bacterium]|nr:molybdate-binding protein ModA [Clostridiales bacterium]